MRTQPELFRSVLLWLLDRAPGEPSDLDDRVRDLYTTLSTVTYPRCSEGDLRGLFLDLPTAGSLMARGKFLWLEPTADGHYPVLGLTYDFREAGMPQICLRVALLSLATDPNVDVRGIGFRFEAPMGVGGQHDYYHAQPFCEFEVGERRWPRLPECPTWISETYPAFKLDAMSPMTLLASLVVSLYGLRSVALLDQVGADLMDALRMMRHIDTVTT